MRENLRFIFWPRSIAVIGASTREGTIGNTLFRNILLNNFTGVVYPVNLKAHSVLGVKAFPSVLHIPDEIDLAIIIVPAKETPQVLEECGQKKVKGCVVISAGFKEIGETGAELERKIQEKSKKYKISLIGPNCFGLINTDNRVRLNSTFGQVLPKPGNIAFVSQSGAVGAAALEYAQSQAIGLSKFVSIGNKADINENDLLAYLIDDEETQCILLYLEDLENPLEFRQLAEKITKRKPILLIKSGRTQEGARAAFSHTGALAGSDEAYNAFFAECGVIRVETLNELFDFALAFAGQPIPKGKTIAILTNAGGMGVMATDAAVRYGLKIAELTSHTEKRLRDKMPDNVNINNPLDIVGDADEIRYGQALRTIIEDENVSGVIAIWMPTITAPTVKIAKALTEIIPSYKKPVLGCLPSLGEKELIREELAKAKIPHYEFPETTARAMAVLCQYGEYRSQKPPTLEIPKFPSVDSDKVREIIKRVRASKSNLVLEPSGSEILKSYGIPVLEAGLAKNLTEAKEIAKRIGYPVSLKIIAPDIVHKFDFGGIRLNIKDETSLNEDYSGLLKTIQDKRPGVQITGVLVQKMAPKGKETILGMKYDPQFGPILLFGMGGTYVETFRDVSFRVVPLTYNSARSMVFETKWGKILSGIRNEPPSDIEAVIDVLLRLSQLVSDFSDFLEIDINPLFVFEQGKGVAVVDTRILLSR